MAQDTATAATPREAFAADPVAQENGTPVLGVSNTAAGITDMGEFVFRNSLPESAVIPGVVSQATEALGLTTAGIIYANVDDSWLERMHTALGDEGLARTRGDVDAEAASADAPAAPTAD